MRRPRAYDDDCPTAHGLELIGERWALLVARELMLGPRRFKDIQTGLKGISPNVLSQRLEELEAAGIISHRQLSAPFSLWVYELTEWGLDLGPVMQALGRWAVRSPRISATRILGPVSFVLSLRAMFDPAGVSGERASLGLYLDGQAFRLTFDGKGLVAEPGEPERPDAIIRSSIAALGEAISGATALDAAIARGNLEVDGDLRVVKRFLSAFPRPPGG